MKKLFNNVPIAVSIPLSMVAFFALFAAISFFVELAIYFFSYPFQGHSLADIPNKFNEFEDSGQLHPVLAMVNVMTFTVLAGTLFFLPINTWKSGLVIQDFNVPAFVKNTLRWLIILLLYAIF